VRVTSTNRGIPCELCRILTDDGLELNGFYQPGGTRDKGRGTRDSTPSPQPLSPSPFCVVHVHGWEGNFYENRFIDHAAGACSRSGVAFAAFNNRGHDYIADILPVRRIQKAETRKQNSELRRRRQEGLDYVQIGGVYEKLTDCVDDIRAWIDFAAGRGATRVILQGHSHGAIKAAYYLTATGDPRVCGLVLLSPSDDMGIARKQLGDRQFLKLLARARSLMRAGKGRQLLAGRELQYPVSAATFYDCHNRDSITGMFNLSRTDREEFPELASIRVPVLMAVGTVNEAFVGASGKYLADVREHLVNCPSFTGAVIEGGPHNYLEHEPALAWELENWLRKMIQSKA